MSSDMRLPPRLIAGSRLAPSPNGRPGSRRSAGNGWRPPPRCAHPSPPIENVSAETLSHERLSHEPAPRPAFFRSKCRSTATGWWAGGARARRQLADRASPDGSPWVPSAPAMLYAVPDAECRAFRDPIGRLMVRAPFAGAAATVILVLLLWSYAFLFDANASRAWLDWVVVGFCAYTVFAALVLIPKVVVPRARKPPSDAALASMRWAFAVAPFLIAFGAVAAGADHWTLAAGVAVSTTLLFLDAKTITRERSSR